jgi:hypothetical protein
MLSQLSSPHGWTNTAKPFTVGYVRIIISNVPDRAIFKVSQSSIYWLVTILQHMLLVGATDFSRPM